MTGPTPGWEFQPDSRDSASTLSTTPTPRTPATTWAEEAAYARGLADRDEEIRAMIMETGISDHEGGFGDTYYARPAAHMLEELIYYHNANAQSLEYAVELLAENLHGRECGCPGSYCPVMVQAREAVARTPGIS
jgi:hypothetical protein